MSLLAFYYGWTIDEIMRLSMPQFNAMLGGLTTILKQKYGTGKSTPQNTEVTNDFKVNSVKDSAIGLQSMFKNFTKKSQKKSQKKKK